MHDNSILVAVDAALRSPSFCTCGDNLTITVHNEVVWLECVRFAAPTRLPAPVATVLRELMHDRRSVIDIPARQTRGRAPTTVPGAAAAR